MFVGQEGSLRREWELPSEQGRGQASGEDGRAIEKDGEEQSGGRTEPQASEAAGGDSESVSVWVQRSTFNVHRADMAGEHWQWLDDLRARCARFSGRLLASLKPEESQPQPRSQPQPSLLSPPPSSPLLVLALQALVEAALFGAGLTPMNSLGYLSRQFDVLASPRAPPSIPTTESPPFPLNGERQTRLKRSGSTKSFLVPQPLSSSGWTLKRSYSSPAEVNPNILSPSSSLLGPPMSRKKPSRPPSRRPSVSSTERTSRLKPGDASPALRHLVFVRIILQLWNALLAALRSLTRQYSPVPSPGAADDAAVEDNSDEDKDTEDESRDENPPSISPVLLDSTPHPPYQPAIPSPLSHPSSPPTKPPLGKEMSPSPISLPSAVSGPKAAVAPASLTPPATRSRSVTPTPPAKQTPFHTPKTLVLDLDETLIHSTSRPILSAGGSGLFGFGRRNKGVGYTVEVVLGGRSTLYHVYKRPFVDYFLRKVSQWYTLVIFTASMPEYADPVIDWLDAGRGIFSRRYFREQCTQLPNGSYTKDLSKVEQDLSRVCLIDNSPVCYSINEANGIPIEGWTHDPHDEALLDLLPVLDSLRFTSDVRRVLGIRGFS
ncbi:transporter [Ganoderma sinense ZZ0214-1]|uniref:Transporter n=1 Tax=Ganoderma sinense ZZ0214-1 TaxID=1077348 RepID=A0A2G8ST54_9APHY|nr:transporter [Ganoderma sinense ZZ0214-1]